MDLQRVIEVWRGVLRGKSWVLFESGTCVVLREPKQNLTVQAASLLKEHGPVAVGTELGDFSVGRAKNIPGWFVLFAHEDIVAFVGEDQFDADEDQLLIGMHARDNRDRDAQQLKVAHVESAQG